MSKEVRHRVTVDSQGAEGNIGRLSRAWESLRGILTRVTGVMRGGRVGLDGISRAAAGATGSMGGLGAAAGKLGIALAVLGAAMRVVRGAAREMGRAIESAVTFQSQTFQIRMLTGSMKEARDVMLQLTESSQAVDHIFGTQEVVNAYRALHNYTDGALASAYAVRVLGQASLVTGKDIGSMADSVGRAWQMIVAGESMNRAGRRLIDGGLVDQSFVNDLQRMQDEGRAASEIFMELWSHIEGRGEGALDGYAQTIQGMRQEIEDFRNITRTAFGELFEPMIDSWTRVKLYLARDFADFARNPLRIVGVRADDTPLDISREAFDSQSPEQQAWWLSQTGNIGDSLAKIQAAEGARQDDDKMRQQALDDWRDQRDARHEEERLSGMTSDELFAEAVKYGQAGDAPDQLRHEQLLERARITAAREAEERERDQELQREAHRRRQEEEDRARDRLEEATFRSSLGQMDPDDQVTALTERRDAELELAHEAHLAGDAVKQFHHELRSLNLQDQIRGVMEQIENEERRRADDAARFEDQKREHELRQMRPEDEIRERRERIEADRAALEGTDDHDEQMRLRRRIWADERRIDNLEEPDAPERDHHRSGLQAYINDLVNIPGLSDSGLDGKSRTQSITERFASRLTDGQLTTSEAGRLSRDVGASAIERMQVELDNERNRLLRELINKHGLAE